MLDRWAEAVGPPLIRNPGGFPERPVVDELTYAVWNTNVGAGDLSAFVSALKRGELLGGHQTRHFVLLLQEVHREGAGIPADPPPSSRGAPRIVGRPPNAERAGIDVLAERAGLALYYVPSMRNGLSEADIAPEDRGNAILSTLPLTALRACELPLERQRRVAITARVRAMTSDGATWNLDWVNVHLDPRSAPRRLHRSFGNGRARQTEWLLQTIEGTAPTLVGGDFNTWTRGAGESAVRRMRSHFRTPAELSRGTFTFSPFLPSLKLDHVFVRLPQAWRSECKIVDSTYGSDHRALVGRIRIGRAST